MLLLLTTGTILFVIQTPSVWKKDTIEVRIMGNSDVFWTNYSTFSHDADIKAFHEQLLHLHYLCLKHELIRNLWLRYV